jgi:hypothetical protein
LVLLKRHTEYKEHSIVHAEEAVMDRSKVLNLAGLAAWLVAVLAALVALVAFLIGADPMVMVCATALAMWMLVLVSVVRRMSWRR